ncbi:response regulator transcription factor [Pseudomonas syringae pv. actinidiae]|uniref:LuxR family transcriptional regulator n=6 Tax=Pseudomonas syringae group TaxID=136849 RepID=A0A656JX55_PSESF|nr:response regulator transcription factor [Pseudomonas syringae]EPN58993.1 LuxR family transcriptional regulator [Pseudomonas syringae pv. actinidiae ICMP 19096]EPN63952.1 LuxR family transcriptional regulator [Pseudomonas syringae pv. actinidiae ICMP 19079]EPN71803.1 LuxR family transcriptional regulator [Pseudomonas syringae pv. actinidiae ICMP 19101]OZI84688.1 DNA-binding response regulator [Pseudomonas avellanae]AKT30728.1 LuxR family transcriptional regulator [Pseudomonas syringae pv. ac
MSLRIVIADDHPIVLLGTQILLEKKGCGTVIGQAKSPEELEAVLNSTACDLLITDFAMPDSERDGLAMLRRLRQLHPALKIIVLTSLQNSSLILSILSLKVNGVIEKNADPEELATAIRQVTSGKTFLSGYFREALANESIISPEKTTIKLAPKEIEVIRLLAAGFSPNEIAEKLSRSIKTISWTKISAKTKLGISSDAELFDYCRTARLIS